MFLLRINQYFCFRYYLSSFTLFRVQIFVVLMNFFIHLLLKFISAVDQEIRSSSSNHLCSDFLYFWKLSKLLIHSPFSQMRHQVQDTHVRYLNFFESIKLNFLLLSYTQIIRYTIFLCYKGLHCFKNLVKRHAYNTLRLHQGDLFFSYLYPCSNKQ